MQNLTAGAYNPKSDMPSTETPMMNLQRNLEEITRVVVRVEDLANRFVGAVPQEVYSKDSGGANTLNSPPIASVLMAHGNQLELLTKRANAALSRIENQF